MEENDAEFFAYSEENIKNIKNVKCIIADKKYDINNVYFTNYSKSEKTLNIQIEDFEKLNIRINIPIDLNQLHNWIDKETKKEKNINYDEFTWF